jgi:hypothetical protein
MTRLNVEGRPPRGLLVAALGCGVLLACQERLAAPVDCPNLCPGGYEVRDTIIDPEDNRDSSFEGYVTAGQGGSLRVSHNFPPSEDRVVLRFAARPDSYEVKTDSVLPYTLDSVALAVSVVYRDTSVKDLYIFLYRLPATVDSNFTFADAEAAFTPSNIIDSLKVDDTLKTQRMQTVLTGPALSRMTIAPGDSGVLAMGVQIRAAQGTGARIGSAGSVSPTFVSYINVFTGDTTSNHQVYTRVPSFSRFVSQTVPPLDLSALTVGGVPSARSILRFPWPAHLRDSAQLIRVSLELVPTAPIPGLEGDTAFLQARPLLADLGSKSPAFTDPFYVSFHTLARGDADTVRLEVLRAATLWQGSTPLPSAFMLQLFPEGASFTRATFGSSRTPGLRPRLRVSYARTFPFEAP